ncbi:hypothetical protein GCM10028807_46440 [Spirosoma daeguense]
MQLQDAIDLIGPEAISGDVPQVWADLGCGSGLFTRALASFLPDESVIYAVDQQMQYELKAPVGHSVKIEFIQADFEKNLPEFPKLDGVLMANALHYVADKPRFLSQLEKYVSEEASILIVEYETTHSNQWVPYPITFSQLGQLFSAVGFTNSIKLGERPSAYRQGNMYAALLKT